MKNQQELQALARDVLGQDYVQLKIRSYELSENLETGRAHISVQLHISNEASRTIESEGVGFVDALFHGLQAAFVEEYPSVSHIFFSDFRVAGEFQQESRSSSHADVPGVVSLVVENAQKRAFEFRRTSSSVSASSVRVVLDAVEHFVNAERAVLTVYGWVQDARQRNRPELAEKYIQRLSELVQNASYSESIERAKQSLGGS